MRTSANSQHWALPEQVKCPEQVIDPETVISGGAKLEIPTTKGSDKTWIATLRYLKAGQARLQSR